MNLHSPLIRDIATLIARLGIGIVFVAHGWQKFFTYGIAGVQKSFAGMGAPLPDVSAIVAATVELVGGFALILGAATAIAGALLFLDMLGAYFIVHIGKGIFVTEGGAELVIALGVGSLLIAAIGAGRFSVDAVVGKSLGRTKVAS